ILGHYNLFLGGVLHRDVSSGNILRSRGPVSRLDLREVDVTSCRGFLVDGDHAVEWRKDAITPSLERSGTLPFMSTRLLQDWRLNKPVLHTAIDDLESFLWVLIWSLVRIFQTFANITKDSIIYDLGHSLSSRVFDHIQRRNQSARDWTDKVFNDLIQEWLNISDTFRIDVKKLQKTSTGLLVNDSDTSDAQKRIFDELDERCGKAYKEFIQSGDRHLRTIRTFSNWEDVVEFDGESLNE
ncbi:hypothetical protein EDB84DRAFT_1261915, partial [Lactarius hengduanensis]